MDKDPFRPTDEQARALAQSLIGSAKHGALAVLLNGEPFASRIALARGEKALLTLISDLAPHTDALRHHPRASIMIGEPGKGDPLAHPRLTLTVQAEFIEKAAAADQYLAQQPKAQLYIGFEDFHLVRLVPSQGLLNGGFGKAYRLTPYDLGF
jgi:putative heme iron utilization protein